MSEGLKHPHGYAVDGGPAPGVEGEVAAARRALEGGDLREAAGRLASAMADAPQSPQVQEALTEFVARAGGPVAALDRFPPHDERAGALACRVRLLGAVGLWDEAVGLLASLVGARPGAAWTRAGWPAAPELAALVRPEVVATAIARIVGGGLPDQLTPELTLSLRPFLDLAAASVAAHPGHAALLTMASGLARRFEDHDRAITWARAAQKVEPGHLQAVMLGYALRAAGQIESALAVWEAEIARDPSDLSLYVDVAELYAGGGRPAEGLPWLEHAVAVEPLHPQAAPALHGARFDTDGDRKHLVALVDLARSQPELGYARFVLRRCSRGEPWLSGVIGAREATIHVMHRLMEDAEVDLREEIRLTTTHLEAPSAILTLRRVVPRANVYFEAESEPDPRLPLHGVGSLVWRYEPDGRTVRPVCPEPPAAAAEAVRAVAAVRWHSLPEALRRAAPLGAVPAQDLLAVLAHPPLPRDDEQGRYLAGHLPELWTRAVQTFACLGIAHSGTDAPWETSRRREILVGLLNGPEDWVTESAGLALVAVAWTDPATRADIGELLAARLMDAAEAAQTRPVVLLDSLCQFVRACPWLSESIAALAIRLSTPDGEGTWGGDASWGARSADTRNPVGQPVAGQPVAPSGASPKDGRTPVGSGASVGEQVPVVGQVPPDGGAGQAEGTAPVSAPSSPGAPSPADPASSSAAPVPPAPIASSPAETDRAAGDATSSGQVSTARAGLFRRKRL